MDVAMSSGATSFCSPLVMFLSITFLAAISVSPVIATKGMPFWLAYCICFFILLASG